MLAGGHAAKGKRGEAGYPDGDDGSHPGVGTLGR